MSTQTEKPKSGPSGVVHNKDHKKTKDIPKVTKHSKDKKVKVKEPRRQGPNPPTFAEFGHGLRRMRTTLHGPQGPKINMATVVTELGKPVPFRFACWNGILPSFILRKHRQSRLPRALNPGRIDIKEAYSVAIDQNVPIPAVGSRVTLVPRMSTQLNDLIKHYRFVRARVHWIFVCLVPLGASITLEVYAPELTKGNKTRGVIWRVADNDQMSFDVGYSHKVAWIDTSKSNDPGFPGFSLELGCTLNNSSESIVQGLNLTAYSIVYDVKGNCWQPLIDDMHPWWFSLQAVSDAQTLRELIEREPIVKRASHNREIIRLQGQDGEEKLQTLPVEDTINPVAAEEAAATPETVEVEKVAEGKPKGPPKKKTNTKSDVAALNQRWVDYKTIAIDQYLDGGWHRIDINPVDTSSTMKGDGLRRIFRRNVWYTGTLHVSYLTTMEIRINWPKAQTLAGFMEIRDTINPNAHRHMVPFGGLFAFPIQPVVLSGGVTNTTRLRHYCSPYQRTSEALHAFMFNIKQYNPTIEQQQPSFSIQTRPGNLAFDVPTKPRPQVSNYQLFAKTFAMMIDAGEIYGLQWKEGIHWEGIDSSDSEESDEELDSEFLVPTEEGTTGEVDSTIYQPDDIPQNDFRIAIFRGEVPSDGSVTALPIVLPQLQDFHRSSGEISTIQEKTERFTNIVPTGKGVLGPIAGSYEMEFQLGTGRRIEVQHICMPDDMSDEAILRIFGIGSILDIAGAALNTIGGPLISGLLNIGGQLLGGGSVVNTTPPQSTSSSGNPAGNPSFVGGDIPFSRFFQLVRPILEDLLQDSPWGTLLFSVVDLATGLARTNDPIPVTIYAKFDKLQFERNVVNADYNPVEAFRASNAHLKPRKKVIIGGKEQWKFTQELPPVLISNQVIPQLIERLGEEIDSDDQDSMSFEFLTKLVMARFKHTQLTVQHVLDQIPDQEYQRELFAWYKANKSRNGVLPSGFPIPT